MEKYTISGSGSTPNNAQKKFDREFAKTNSRLAEDNLPVLEKKLATYTIDCVVNPEDAGEFSKVLNKTYPSTKGFEDAEAIAKKGYRKIPFTIREFGITMEYSLSSKEKETLVPHASTPAYHNRRAKDITRHLE